MREITLDNLINDFRERIPKLRYIDGMIPHYTYDDMDNYEKWLAATKRYLSIHFPNDKSVLEFEDISKKLMWKDQQQRLLAILEAIADLPTLVLQNGKTQDKKEINITTNINNTNNQSQSQEQSLAIDIFLEAIKDNLTGRQIKELKQVVDELDGDKEKEKKGIIAKLKGFGSDVVASIVANILTNPTIWNGL